MNSEAKRSGRWQFSLRTLFVILTIAAPLVAVFSGAFGETLRAYAVNLLVRLAPYLLPISTLAVYALLILCGIRLARRVFSRKA